MYSQVISGLDTADVLKTAIYNEKLAADYYDSMADYCSRGGNPKAADFFRYQAMRERGHFNGLMKFMKRRGESNTPALGEVIAWVGFESANVEKMNPKLSLDDSLRHVEKREAEAFAFYDEYSAKVDDPEVASLFKHLALEEARHMKLAQKTRNIYERRGLLEEPEYEDLGLG